MQMVSLGVCWRNWLLHLIQDNPMQKSIIYSSRAEREAHAFCDEMVVWACEGNIDEEEATLRPSLACI